MTSSNISLNSGGFKSKALLSLVFVGTRARHLDFVFGKVQKFVLVIGWGLGLKHTICYSSSVKKPFKVLSLSIILYTY